MPNVFKVNTVHSRTLMVFSFFRKKCLGFVIFFFNTSEGGECSGIHL